MNFGINLFAPLDLLAEGNLIVTDEQKQHQLQLVNMALLSLSAGTWNVLGESALALSGPMGESILEIMSQEMKLDLAGGDPEVVIKEISRIFVEKFAFAGEIQVERKDDQHFELKVCQCVNRTFTDELLARGVEKPFICPILNACQAALRRMGYKLHGDVEKWTEGGGSVITFKGL